MTVFQFWMIWLQIVHFYNLHSNKMATFTMEFGYTVHCVQLLGYLMSVFSILICCTRISVRDFHERYLYRGPYQGFESIVDRTRKSSSPFLKYQKVIFWQWIHEWKGSFFWHGNNLQYQDINTKLILLDSLETKWRWLGFGIHVYNFQLYLKLEWAKSRIGSSRLSRLGLDSKSTWLGLWFAVSSLDLLWEQRKKNLFFFFVKSIRYIYFYNLATLIERFFTWNQLSRYN